MNFQESSSSGVAQGAFTSTATNCSNMCGMFSVRKAHLSLGFQDFYWRVVT